MLPVPGLTATCLHVAKGDYMRDGYVRLDNAFADPEAHALHAELCASDGWLLSLRGGGKHWDVSPGEFTKIGEARLKAMARQGGQTDFRYLYDVIRVRQHFEDAADPALLAGQCNLALNAPQVRAALGELVGEEVRWVSSLATRYRTGHFLTPHNDSDAQNERIAAYVLGLSPKWLPDWGGQLQMLDADRAVRAALVPRFNCLNLFKVPQTHCVSPVEPAALVPRYSITGWLFR